MTSRLRMLRKIGWDDYAILACQILFVLYLICQIIGAHYGFGKRFELMTIHDSEFALFVSLARSSSCSCD